MKIYSENSEPALMEFINHIRPKADDWRALHFHFSFLKPENRQSNHLQMAVNIVQTAFELSRGSAWLCRDGDIIVVFEQKASKPLDSVIMDLRFLFVDDPLSSAIYVSGKEDNFFSTYDLSISFDQFFYLCLNKLAKSKQPDVSITNIRNADEIKAVSEVHRAYDPAIFKLALEHRKERQKLLIMVAEDSYFSRQLVRQALMAKYDVIQAKDGFEALDLYLFNAPNIVFLDIGMPNIDGQEVLKRIAAHDPMSFVVMLTASNQGNSINQAISSGAKGYIVKPFTINKLTAYIDMYNQNLPSALEHKPVKS